MLNTVFITYKLSHWNLMLVRKLRRKKKEFCGGCFLTKFANISLFSHNTLITTNVEVMSLPVYICLFASLQNTSKTYGWILMNFLGNFDNGLSRSDLILVVIRSTIWI